MRKQYTAEQREKLIAEVRASGARVSQVAKNMGVSASTAYLWMKAATGSAPVPSAPEFARVVPAKRTQEAHVLLEVSGAKVRVGEDFDAALLRRVVAALSAAS